MRQFLRADTFRLKRLGSHRRKLKKWRRPRGKHNKLRLKRTGHPQMPSIGFGTPRTEEYLIKGKKFQLIQSAQQLTNLPKDTSVILSRRLGAKKKLEIIKQCEEKKITIININKNSGQKTSSGVSK